MLPRTGFGPDLGRVLLLGAALLSGLGAPLLGQPGGAEWKAGLASVKITPGKPMLLAGYAARTQPFEAVESDLYAEALALEDSAGHRAVLITADTLGFPGAVSEAICRRIRSATGLEREAILLNGSHTHAGPLVRRPIGQQLPAAQEALVDAYTAQLENSVVKIAREALGRMEPARLSWDSGVALFAMNRREFTDRGVILGANARGLVDRSVPVLRVETPDGRLRAVVFQAAVHGTTLTGKNLRLCGDYAGFAKEYLRRRFPGVQAMFMIGCAGAANPYPRGTMQLARQHGEALGREVERVLSGRLKPVRGPLRTELRRVDLPLQKLSRRQIEAMGKDAPSYRKFFVKNALALLDQGKTLPGHYTAPFALWQFGKDLTLVAFSGETVVDYLAMTEKALGPLRLWVAGYSNDLYGYLVTSQTLAEGGYETRGLYTGVGLFAPGVEKVVMDAIVGMARAAGRPMPAKP